MIIKPTMKSTLFVFLFLTVAVLAYEYLSSTNLLSLYVIL